MTPRSTIQLYKMNAEALYLLTWKISKSWRVRRDTVSMADFAGKASSVLFCSIWLHFQKMSLKGLMPIEHSVCLGGGEDSPGRELFSMFCTLMILIPNVILTQNGIFKQEEASQTVRQQESQAERFTSAKTVFILWRE